MPVPRGSATTPRSIAAAAEKGQGIDKRYGQPEGPGRGGLRRAGPSLRVGAAAEENQAARRASGGARDEQNGLGGAGGVEGRQILEEQSILEVSYYVQMYVSSLSVGVQARRSATGGSPPPISWVRLSDRWTACRGAPPCDMDLAGNTAIWRESAKWRLDLSNARSLMMKNFYQ
jgi:hypothetical protein